MLPTNYFIILTRRCNLKCKYCGEDYLFEEPPIDLDYPISALNDFLEKDNTPISIQFYGGEPLLKIPLMEKIIDSLDFVQYWTVQTNALRLSQLDSTYFDKIKTILVSIDGRADTTDFNRGTGVYSKVLKNCQEIRANGYSGELVARMAVSEVADIYEEVRHLDSLDNPSFDYIHWQLDTQWDDDIHARWKNFDNWLNFSYNPGISKLVDWWYNEMTTGRVVGIVPFLPIINDLLNNTSSSLRCGAGIDSFAINPNGSISVCPISPEFKFSIVGDIWKNTPQDIHNTMFVGDPCPDCDVYGLCGGRCLFINKTKLWGEKGFIKVCSSVKHLIRELERIVPSIKELINNQVIKKEAFNYPLYNNGCEIIP